MLLRTEEQTWAGLLARAASRLEAAGVASPRNDAELLMRHLTGDSRAGLALSLGEHPASVDAERFWALVERRVRREPLQHITGWVSFAGIELKSDGRALVPRPETELLAVAATGLLRESARLSAMPVVDLCTGSGAIALAIVAAMPGAEVWATDLSAEALALAGDNCAALGVATELAQGDLFDALPDGLCGRVGLVCANPPYIAEAELEQLPPEVRDHDPRVALDGGADGMSCIRRIAGALAEWLAPGGQALIEVGDGQWRRAASLFSGPSGTGALVVNEPIADLGGRERILRLSKPPLPC